MCHMMHWYRFPISIILFNNNVFFVKSHQIKKIFIIIKYLIALYTSTYIYSLLILLKYRLSSEYESCNQ